ncbi:MAG: peptide deformylase [Tissierellia bacterium]|nr:peptide deformylase [Tissierellia bacterium]
MALRVIRTDEDPLLRKVSRPVKDINDRMKTLLDDMVETMRDAEGIGLAAPQVGILRRCIVVDVGQGTYKMINPEIIEESGSDIDIEGCLSVPNFNGTVERPEHIKVRYLDEEGKENTIEADGLFARCICHEVDHLNGILFTDKYIDEVSLEDIAKGLAANENEEAEQRSKKEDQNKEESIDD